MPGSRQGVRCFIIALSIVSSLRMQATKATLPNLIRRSALGLGKEGWGKLLNQQATGALSWPDVAGEITGTRNEVLISMNGSDSRLRVSHGLVNLQGTDEQCYLIDNDFFVEGKIDSGDALNRLDGFHKDAGRFFRWWVSDKLQKVMGPQAP